MSIERTLETFLASKQAGAIVLKGKWGVGKTYFWRYRIIQRIFNKPWKKRYSYVSLFGINSLSELKTALAVATAEFDQDAKRAKRKSARVIGWWWKAASWLSDALGAVPRVGPGLAKLNDRIGFFLVRDRIVCFDDVERHGKGLDLKDFLGLVSYLVDQRGCRVVVILNSGQLDKSDQLVWDETREKVFEGEIAYAPTLNDTIALGLGDTSDQHWNAALREALEILRISNIRLVRRTVRFMQLALSTSSQPVSEKTQEHIAKALAILVYAVHGRGEGAPPVDMVMRRGQYTLSLGREKGAEQTPEYAAWTDTINRFGLYLHTPLDHSLLTMVEAGYPDADELNSALRDFEDNEALYARKEAWHQSWRQYHDTVRDNPDEIIAAFESTWPAVSAHEHANNLEGMVRILRLLGRSDLATSYIRQWVAERSGDRLNSLDPRELHMFRRVEDPELIAAVESARTSAARKMDLQGAFEIMRDRDYYDQNAIAAFSEADVEDIVRVIDANEHENLASALRRLLELAGHGSETPQARAAEKIRLACQVIAARSELSAYRMKGWFGIEPVDAALLSGVRSS